MVAVVYTAHEVAEQVFVGVEVETGLAHARNEHPGHVKENLPMAGAFVKNGLVEFIAEFHGQVPKTEYGKHGLEPALEDVNLVPEMSEGVHLYSSSSSLSPD